MDSIIKDLKNFENSWYVVDKKRAQSQLQSMLAKLDMIANENLRCKNELGEMKTTMKLLEKENSKLKSDLVASKNLMIKYLEISRNRTQSKSNSESRPFSKKPNILTPILSSVAQGNALASKSSLQSSPSKSHFQAQNSSMRPEPRRKLVRDPRTGKIFRIAASSSSEMESSSEESLDEVEDEVESDEI